MIRHPPKSPLFPYPTLFRSANVPPHPADRRRKQSSAPEVSCGPRYLLRGGFTLQQGVFHPAIVPTTPSAGGRSEEHTSELQSQSNLVCRLLLEKKKHTTSQQ